MINFMWQILISYYIRLIFIFKKTTPRFGDDLRVYTFYLFDLTTLHLNFVNNSYFRPDGSAHRKHLDISDGVL